MMKVTNTEELQKIVTEMNSYAIERLHFCDNTGRNRAKAGDNHGTQMADYAANCWGGYAAACANIADLLADCTVRIEDFEASFGFTGFKKPEFHLAKYLLADQKEKEKFESDSEGPGASA